MKSFKHKNSLLYKITGNRLKKPSYLLGTMHAICSDDFVLSKKVLQALQKCSTYYMEVDLGSAQEMQFMSEQATKIPDIFEGLSGSEKEELTHILQDQFDLSFEEAKQEGPLTLINRLAIDAIDCDEIKVPEMELLKIAQEKGLQTAGMETVLEQLNIAQKVFTGKEILRQLKSAGAYKELFDKIVKAYHSENLQELSVLIADKQFMSKKVYNVLVINRNKRWAKAIPTLIENQSAFFAVGAGHLPGDGGLLQLLIEMQYAVNPVYR
ncbi:MAG TPA: TraB/GumN family protein [Hanamia sp.]